MNRRLLAYEDRHHTRRVELTHDVLVPVIKASRDSRLTRESPGANRIPPKGRSRNVANGALPWRWPARLLLPSSPRSGAVTISSFKSIKNFHRNFKKPQRFPRRSESLFPRRRPGTTPSLICSSTWESPRMDGDLDGKRPSEWWRSGSQLKPTTNTTLNYLFVEDEIPRTHRENNPRARAQRLGLDTVMSVGENCLQRERRNYLRASA